MFIFPFADSIALKTFKNTQIVTEEGDIVKYYYNYKHLLYSKTTERSNATETQNILYDAIRNMPVRIETKIADDAGSFIKSLDLYTYDTRGNLLSENHPEDPSDENNTDYKIKYTYDSTYNLLSGKTYSQDEDTEISVQYTLSGDKKSIVSEKTLSNGNSLQEIRYEYDNCGNMIQRAVKVNADDWAVTSYVYGSEYGYAFPTSVTWESIVDADGATRDVIES